MRLDYIKSCTEGLLFGTVAVFSIHGTAVGGSPPAILWIVLLILAMLDMGLWFAHLWDIKSGSANW